MEAAFSSGFSIKSLGIILILVILAALAVAMVQPMLVVAEDLSHSHGIEKHSFSAVDRAQLPERQQADRRMVQPADGQARQSLPA